MPQTIALDADDVISSIRAKLESAVADKVEVVVPDGLDALRSPLGMRRFGRLVRRSGIRASISTHDDVVKRLARREGIPVKSLAVTTGVRDRKSTRLNSSHIQKSRMPSSA